MLVASGTAASPYTSGRSEEHTSELQSHRDLHSFPTRRSSDLKPGHQLAAQTGEFPAQRDDFAREALQGRFVHHPLLEQRVAGAKRLGVALELRKICWLRLGQQQVHIPPADRKSTRLNSSHTEIYTLSLHDALPI